MSSFLRARTILCALLTVAGFLIAGNAPASAAGTQSIDTSFPLRCTPGSVWGANVRIKATVPATVAPGESVRLSDVSIAFNNGFYDDLPFPGSREQTMQAYLDGLSLSTTGATPASLSLAGTPRSFSPIQNSPGGFAPLPGDIDFGTTTAGTKPVVLRLESLAYAASVFNDSLPTPPRPTTSNACTPRPGLPPLAVIPSTGAIPPSPVVTGLSPSYGPVGGGNIITISGSGFDTGVESVEIGYATITDVTVVDDRTITVKAPVWYQEKTVDVRVRTDFGQSAITAADRYSFGGPPVPDPVITSITPNAVPATGGVWVTARGTDLDRVDRLTLDGSVPVYGEITANADGTELRFLATDTTDFVPGVFPVGAHRVTAYGTGACVTPDCASPDTPGSYLYYGTTPPAPADPPVVTSVSGYAWGGLGGLLRIRGSKFAGAKYVTVGTKKVRPLLVLGGADLLVLAPPLPKGRYPVAVGTATAVSAPASRATINYR